MRTTRPECRAGLVTGGMLLLVYALVKAPDVGWGTTRTIAELAIAGVILAAFVVNELRVANPLVPLSILRVKGVAAANATQTLMLAGFFRCSSSSPSTCRPCSTTRRSRRARPICR
jgi:hypothetical protein